VRIFQIVGHHDCSIFEGLDLLQHIFWVLRYDLNPILHFGFSDVEGDNLLQRCLEIRLEEKLLVEIMDVVVCRNPLGDDWAHFQFIVQLPVLFLSQVSIKHQPLPIIALVQTNE